MVESTVKTLKMGTGKEKDGSDKAGSMPLTSAPVGYSPEEMSQCGNCGKWNPPDRFRCLYCGGELTVADSGRHPERLKFRRPETWEAGFNVILLPAQAVGDASIAKAAVLLGSEPKVLDRMVKIGEPLPAARVEGRREAETLEARLREYGFVTRVVADEDLSGDDPPVRLRRLDFTAAGIDIYPFNTDERISTAADELRLLVVGSLVESKNTITEKRKGAKRKLLDEVQTARDEQVLDIYTATSKKGFRVPTHGFDFSSLGSGRSLVAAENLSRLAKRLSEIGPHVRFIDSYDSVREMLEPVWETETRSDSLGLQRSGFGKVDFGKRSTTSNLRQFTLFSRLQRQLL